MNMCEEQDSWYLHVKPPKPMTTEVLTLAEGYCLGLPLSSSCHLQLVCSCSPPVSIHCPIPQKSKTVK